MSPRSAAPITDDVIAAIAKFFHGGAGPSHSEISRVLTGTGYSDDYTYDPDVQGPNKEKRVLRGLALAKRQPARARELVDGLLSLLRVNGLIGEGAAGEASTASGELSGPPVGASPKRAMFIRSARSTWTPGAGPLSTNRSTGYAAPPAIRRC